jgi:hypothetical protein
MLSNATEALHNVISAEADVERRNNELRLLKHISRVCEHTLMLRMVRISLCKYPLYVCNDIQVWHKEESVSGAMAADILQTVNVLMKQSFDETQRHVAAYLGEC